MSKRVTFHVGLHKTGSSTIQQYLRDHDEKLRSHGILYPGPREHEVMNERESHPLMFIAMTGLMTAPSSGLDLQGCREVVARAFDEFHEWDLENLIWSYEAMALTARAWDAGYLERILHGVDVRIVFVARYTDDWIESLYKELIRSRGGPRAEVFYAQPMPPIAPLPGAHKGAGAGSVESLMEQGARTSDALRIMRRKNCLRRKSSFDPSMRIARREGSYRAPWPPWASRWKAPSRTPTSKPGSRTRRNRTSTACCSII